MYAQLGDVVFQLVGPLTGMDSRRAYGYAQHAVIEGKPRLQFIGDELEEITFDLVFDAAFVDPIAAGTQLRALAARHEAVPLLFAGGDVRGRYVVEEIQETLQETDAEGAVTRARWRVRIREWTEDQILEVTSRRRRQPTAVRSQQRANARRHQVAPVPDTDPHSVGLPFIVRGF